VGVVDMPELWVMMFFAAAVADGALFWNAARCDKRDRMTGLHMDEQAAAPLTDLHFFKH
jgi:hypothetical protein